MAEIVNLRLARKRQRRSEKEKIATESRVRHGRSGGEKAAAEARRAFEEKRLESHRRDIPEGTSGADDPS